MMPPPVVGSSIGLKVDVMSPSANVIGFSNRWYPLALETAVSHEPQSLGADALLELRQELNFAYAMEGYLHEKPERAAHVVQKLS